MSSLESRRLVDLLEVMVGGALSADQAGELNALLASDPAARRRYLVFMEMHGTLHWQSAPPAAEALQMWETSSGDEPNSRPASWRWAVGILIVAALAVGYFAWRGSRPAGVVATNSLPPAAPKDAVPSPKNTGPASTASASIPGPGHPSTRPKPSNARDLTAYYAKLAADPRVIALFDFQPVANDPTRLPNLAKSPNAVAAGRTEGRRLEPGRFHNRVAVRTGANNESIVVDVPGARKAFTLAAWVNVFSLDGGGLPENRTVDGWYTQSLLMTDSQPKEGQYVHWQLNWAGTMSLSVNTAGPQPNYNTLTLITREDLNRWHHLALTYDLEKDRVCFYHDGALVYAEAVQIKQPLTIGKARVGTWLTWDLKRTGRRLDGKIDELLIADAALSDRDVAELYAAGRPSNAAATRPAD